MSHFFPIPVQSVQEDSPRVGELLRPARGVRIGMRVYTSAESPTETNLAAVALLWSSSGEIRAAPTHCGHMARCTATMVPVAPIELALCRWYDGHAELSSCVELEGPVFSYWEGHVNGASRCHK